MSEHQFVENALYFRHWPSSQPTSKAVITLVHGLGEHCERYGALANAFTAAGYAVCAVDLPGHGRSEGTPGHIDSFEQYLDAALLLHAKADAWYPNLPKVLLGHSMGGLIATRLLLEHQEKFACGLLSGPAIQSPQEPPSWQIGVMKLVSKVAPKAGMLTLDASGISRDAAVVEKYMADPLVNKGKLSAQLLVEMFSAMSECKDRANQISLPIRIMHGAEDPMTSPEGSQLLFDSVSSDDKEVVIYKGLMHEIFNEPEQEQIFSEIIQWLDDRIVPS